MKHIFISILLFFMTLGQVNGQASVGEITGKIRGEENGKTVSLVGANVYWALTQTGTVTDYNGQFSLPKHPQSSLLVISYIGYLNDTIIVDGQSSIDVVLAAAELDEVIVAAREPGTVLSRMTPMLTQTITGAELCKAACCNLSESFETNASVDVSYSDAATGAKQIQLLGLSGNYVQMMTENIPNFRGLATPYGLGYIPGSWMESIQVSKGTGTVINGYEALTGQINVEYKKPVDSEKFFVNLFGNSNARAEANVNGSIHLNEKLSTAILSHYSNDTKAVDENDDGFRDEPNMRQFNFINRWDYNSLNGFTAQAGMKIIDERRLGGQTAFEGSQPSVSVYGINIDTKRFEGYGKAGYVFKDQLSSIGLIANYSYHQQGAFYGLKTYDAKQHSLYANLIFQSYIKNENNKFSTGLGFQSDQIDEDYLSDFRDDASKKVYTRNEVVPGAFFQYTFNIPDKLTVVAGLRADHHNEYGGFVTPRLHVKYNLTPSTILRASGGKGYRTPNVLAENSYLLANSRELIIADDIDQEVAWNYGANVTQYIPLFERELTVNVEYYRTDFLNQLVVDADQSAREVHFYNLNGTSYANNFQVEAKYELFRGMEMVAAWRVNEVKTTINGALMDRPLRSNQKGLLTFSYATPLKKWQYDFTTQFNGEGRISSTIENPAEYQRPESFDAYQVMNAQVTKYFKTWNVYVGVENLGNFKQSDPIIAANDPFGSYFDGSLIWGPVMGRRFYFGLRFAIDREE
jgi:outer membrane receptor for ferrienterochelin and colicin